jgi:hypothetical protein
MKPMNTTKIEKRIGKIQEVSVGFGGYQDAMLGLSVTLGSDKDGWGVGEFKGFWGPDVDHSERCKWTEEQRRGAHADTMLFIGKILQEAKVSSVDKLRGKPVEVELDFNTLKSWRILTEVL